MNLDDNKVFIKRILNSVTGLKPFKRKLPSIKSFEKILIISLYFKGDFLFHTTLIETLNKLLPDSKIDLWIKSRLSDILFGDPRFNEIMVFDDIKTANYRESMRINIKGKLNFLKKLRKSKYDLVIDLTGKYSTALFTLFSKSKYSIGLNYNYFGFCYDKFVNLNTSTEKGHLIDKYLQVLRIGLKLDNFNWEKLSSGIELRPYLYIDKAVKLLIEEIYRKVIVYKDKPLVILHATSGWNAKETRETIFAEIVKYLNSKQFNFAFIGDSKDEEKISKIRSLLNDSEFEYSRHFIKLKFIESVELIRRSDLFIGSDSAPLHAAGSVGTPTIGIFGPTNPEFSKPIGNFHKVIYHQLLCSASEERQYCTRNAGMTCPTIDCMKMITSSEIISRIEEILKIYC